VPSWPGIGFSGPTADGRGGSVWRAPGSPSCRRLGYERYGAAGNDGGSQVSPEVGRLDVAQAKSAVGDRNVHVIGAYTAQRALEAELLDEIQLHVVPVLFGGGRRLIDVLSARVQLEVIRVIDTPQATHLRYRVRR
jgi:riboflavin biosynthesis pyrimidine reductase